MARVFLDFRVRTGGVGRYARQLVGSLAAADPELELLVYEAGGRRIVGAPFTPWGRRAAGRAASSWGAHLIHGLHLELPPTERPAIITLQDVCPLDVPASMPSPLRRVIFRRLVAASLRRATRVVVPSEATAASLRAHFWDHHGIRVIPLAVADTFRPGSEEDRLRAQRRFADGGRYVASIWHHKAHKNVGVLPRAATLLRSRSGVQWLCIAAPPSVDELRTVAPLSDEDLRLFYAGAEVLVLPSIAEGFGYPVAEALACGTPAVCGQGVGAISALDGGVVVADVTNPASIAQAAATIIEDADRRARLSAAGLVAARSLTPGRMATETAAVYREVLEVAGGQDGGA